MNKIFETYSVQTLRFRLFFLFCGLLMLVSEIWKQTCLTFFVNAGTYEWRYFPFQLCSVPMYILLVLPYVKRPALRHIFLTFLMTFGLLGGIAVFADTSGLHYPLFALTFHSYAWHVLLIFIGVLAALARFSESPGALLPLCDYRGAVLLYLLCCAAAAVINRVCGKLGTINLFYINPAYHMEQIIFSDLVPVLGNVPVILLYITMTISGAGILFLLWQLLLHFFYHDFTQHPKTQQIGDSHQRIEQVRECPDEIQ